MALALLLPRLRFTHIRGVLLLVFLLAEQYSFSLFYDTNWPKLTNARFGSPTFAAERQPAITAAESQLGSQRFFEAAATPYLTTQPVLNGDLNLPDHRSSLNGIEPLISRDVNEMLGYFPNGVSPYADRLASGSPILSLSAVKFIVAPSAWPRRTVLDRVVEIAAGAPMTSLSPLRLTDWSLFDVQYSSNRENSH